MLKKLLLFACVATGLGASAIEFQYGNFDATAKTCTLTGWTGSLPTATRLNIPAQVPQGSTMYTVSAIAEHALDNLTNITEIVIPYGVSTIGRVVSEISSSGNQTVIGDCSNFAGCPNLTKILVNTDNEHFASTASGLLYSKKMTVLLKVPQNVATSSGAFSIPDGTKTMCPMAFAENTTITTLTLPASTTISTSVQEGFNRMTKLRQFVSSGTSSNFAVVDGVLFSANKDALYSFPPLKQAMSYIVPSTVKTLGYECFANTANLYRVDMTSVTLVKSGAFYRSGVTSLEFPSTVTTYGENAVRACPRLGSLTIGGNARILENFARDCTQLTSVNFRGKGVNIWKSAFKDCHKLETVNFSADLIMDHDSIFAGCGFKEIKFGKSTYAGDYDLGAAIFDSCSYLTKVDMSEVTLTPTSNRPNPAFGIPVAFVTNCPKLDTVIFNQNTAFWASNAMYAQNFGYNSPVKTMVLGSFILAPDHNILCYTAPGQSCKVYMRTTDATWQSWPMNEIFKIDGNGTYSSTIYCEAYSMEIPGKPMNFFNSGSTYYVPGNCPSYDVISGSVNRFFRMYDYRNVNASGKFRLNLARLIAEVDFTKVVINDTQEFTLPDPYYGYILTNIPYEDVNSVTVYYTVNGVEMKTTYPKPEATALKLVEEDGELLLSIELSGRKAQLSADSEYEVFDLRGATVARGFGSEIDLEPVAAGVYVVRATDTNGHTGVAKLHLR